MKTTESKTNSVASSTKAKQPFFGKGEELAGEHSHFFSAPPIQTKLNIGQPNDKYEKEADSMADKVVQRLATIENPSRTNKTVQTKLSSSPPENALTEEKKEEPEETEEKVRRKPIFESNADPPDDEIKRKPIFESEAEGVEQLRKKADGAGGDSSNNSTPSIESRLNSSKSGGAPLAPDVNRSMGKAFGKDFSNVRVHNDSSAESMSKDLNAQAFTHGKDIYFNSGKYDTNSTSGKHLLAHELTHTVQQGNAVRKKDEKKDDKKEKKKGPLKKASDADLQEQKKTKGDYKGFFSKKGSTYELHIEKLLAKRYLKEKEVKIDTPFKLPGPAEERKTKQMSIWKKNVKEETLKLISDICNVPEKDTDKLLKLALKKAQAKGLIGTFKQVVDEVIVPFWGKNGKPMLYDVEHMIDWQLVGGKADVIENLILLDRSYNRTLGNEVKNSIDTHISKLAEHYRKEFLVNTNADNLRANFQIVVDSLDYQEERIKKEQRYTKEELTNATEGAYRKVHIEVGPATIPKGHFLLKTTMGRAGYILPYNAKKERVGSWFVTTKYNKKSEEIESIKLELAIEDKDKIIETGKGDVEPINYKKFDAHVYQIDGTDLRKQFGSAFKELQVKPFSPIQLDEPDLEGFNAKVSGKIVSNISFLKDVDIRFEFENGEYLIRAEIPIDGVAKNIPKPFEVTSCSIILAAGSREGLTLAGNLAFKLGKFGEGELTAGINSRKGFFLDGTFDFDSKYFNPANITFGYEKGKWSIKGTIGIGEGKITGVKSATLEVGYKDDKFTAEGNAELTVPGIEKIKLTAEFDVKGNFAFAAEVALGKLPGIKSGKVKVTVKSKEGEEGIKVAAAGSAIPDFPAIPDLSSEFTVLYDDGIFDVKGKATYKKGRFTGTVEIGVTNKTVDDKGKPGNEKPPEKGPVVIYGFGQLTVDLWKENKGTVGVRLTPEKDVLVSGLIIFKDLKPFGDGYHIEKPILVFPTIEIPLIGLPGLSISAFIGGGVYFKFDWDPLVLKELKVELKEINVNEIENATLDIHGSVGSVADAQVYAQIKAGLKGRALIATLSGSIGGEAGLGIRAEAGGAVDATFNKDKGLQFKEIRAYMNVTPRAIFRLFGDVSVDLDLWFTTINLYYHKWVLAEKELDLAGLTLKLDFPIKFTEDNSMILPSYEQMNVQKPDFSGSAGRQIMDDALNSESKKEVEEKKRKIREDVKYDLRKGQYDEKFTLTKYKKKMQDKYEDNEALREFVLKTIDEEAKVLEYELFDKRKAEIKQLNVPLNSKLTLVQIYTMWSIYLEQADVESFRQELIREDEEKRKAQQASQLPPELDQKDKLPENGTTNASSAPPPPSSNSSVQTKPLPNKNGKSPNNGIESKLDKPSGGKPIDKGTKDEMESATGHDYSDVNIHTDREAADMSQDLNAQAFTHGKDIYFNEGKYNTNSTEGKRLIAHELTHTVQQSNGANGQVQRKEGDDPKTIKTDKSNVPSVEQAAKNIYTYMSAPNPAAHREEIFMAILLQKNNRAALKSKYFELYTKDLEKVLVEALNQKDGIRAKCYLKYGELRVMDKIYLASIGAGTDEDTLYRLMPVANKAKAKVEDDFKNETEYTTNYPKTNATLPDKSVSLVAGLLEDELGGADLFRAKALYNFGKLRAVDEIRIAYEDRNTDDFIAGFKNGMSETGGDKATAFSTLEADYLKSYDSELFLHLTMAKQTGIVSEKEFQKIRQIIGKGSAMERIRDAVWGPGTDEDTIYDAIQTATGEELTTLRADFNNKSSELYKLLDGDLNKEEMDRVAALLSENPTAQQQLDAVGATDGDAIFNEIKMSSGEKFLKYREAFNNPDGMFERYISGKMNAEQKANTITVINGTPETKITMAIGKWSDDEDYIFHVLKNFAANDPAKISIKENVGLMKNMENALSTADYNKVLDLLRLSDESIEQKVAETGKKIKRERSWIADMSHAGDAMDDEYRELVAGLDRAKADGEIDPKEQSDLNQQQQLTDQSIEVYTKVRDELEETAATVLTTVTAVLIAVGTGGLGSGLSAALIAQQLAQAALVSALARVAAMKVAKGDRFEVFGADGAATFAAGAVEGVFNVFGGAVAGKVVDKVLQKAMQEAAQQAGQKAFQSVGRKLLTDAVEGGLSAGVGAAVETSAKEDTWKQGFVSGIENVVEKTATATAMGAGMAAGISGAGMIISKLRGKDIHGADGGEGKDLADEAKVKKLKDEVENRQLGESVKSSGRKQGPELTQVELNAEINWAARNGEVKPSTVAGYTHEVDLGNGHFLRRKDNGTWCRFSSPELCGIPGGPLNGKVAGAGGVNAPVVKPKGKASGKEWDDPGITLKETIADYRAANPTGELTDEQIKEYFKNGFRVHPETGRFNLIPKTVKGTPRADLPGPGSKAYKKWQDFLEGKGAPCFIGSTIVKTPGGNKQIKDIRVGDRVFTYNYFENKVESKTIVALYENWAENLIELNLNGEVITATPNHAIWVENENRYYRSDELQPNWRIKLIDGSVAEIQSLTKRLAQEVTFNFEVADFHNYFVGDAGMLVHNDDVDIANASKFADTTTYLSTVYVLKDPDTLKVLYVGQSIQDLESRFMQHLTDPSSSVYQYLKKKYPNIARRVDGFSTRDIRDFFKVSTPVNGVSLTQFELAVWEQFYIDSAGGKEALLNKINAITADKLQMYRELHNPCG